jgi:hypothetical protein
MNLLIISGIKMYRKLPSYLTCIWSKLDVQPVRSAYQPPASSTFLSEQTSHHQPANCTFLSQQISTSHQPPAKRTGWLAISNQSFPALCMRFLRFSYAASKALLSDYAPVPIPNSH